MQPLVSICIPTYNRVDCLKKTIDSIICQPEFQSGDVEIVVSDNASEDKTFDLCKQYSHYENFFYSHNEHNINDKNFPRVLSIAHGKLRKLNNDTFVLKSDALAKLCAIVKKYDNTRPYIFLLNDGNDVKEIDFRNFVLNVSYFVTWIGGFTAWDSDCENIESDIDDCELKLWQVGKALEIAYKKNLVVVSHQILGDTIAPPKKDISYGLYQVFYCNYMKLLQPYVDSKTLKNEDIEYLEKDLLFRFFKDFILSFELQNTDMQYSKEENLKKAVWGHYKNKSYFFKFKNIYYKELIKLKTKKLIKNIIGKQ